MEFEGKKVLVVGIARSGVAAARLLASRGAMVIANDIKTESDIRDAAEELRKLDVMLSLGAHPESLFVNADLIADGLSPFHPSTVAVRAGRLMLEEINRHARTGVSFAFETTLAGRRYAQLIPRWQRSGYSVHLIFLQLHNEALAVERVAVRVTQGGIS